MSMVKTRGIGAQRSLKILKLNKPQHDDLIASS